jgi:putative transposase
MATAFVAEHRGQFSVRAMCRCLRIQPSGFYAWLQAPLSHRAQEDKRQSKMVLNAWTDSGKVDGYRKLHDDLLEQGESICPNRVARLAQLAGIKARIGISGVRSAMAAHLRSWSTIRSTGSSTLKHRIVSGASH